MEAAPQAHEPLASFRNLADTFKVDQEGPHASTPNSDRSRSPSRGGPPITFKAEPRSRTLNSAGITGEAMSTSTTQEQPQHQQQQQQQQQPQHQQQQGQSQVHVHQHQLRTRLPPIANNDYLIQHHTLKPRTTASSAYIKRHHASHGMLQGQPRAAMQPSETAKPSPAVRMAVLRALAVNAEMWPSRVLRSAGTETVQTVWSNTSVGDLEALDSILDNLVVKDANMREALLKGPLISFETVVPEPKIRTWFQPDAEYKDETFITGVQGVEVAEEQEEEELSKEPPPPAAPQQQEAPEPEVAAPSGSPKQLGDLPKYQRPTAVGAPPPEVVQDQDMLRETIPVPILPKLARMYITTRKAPAAMVPPMPPPTAEYLVRSRPAPIIAAPSYDELCTQIRDVQRQYTCGTAKERNPSPGRSKPPRTNTDMYISGLDGPTLGEMVNYEELPVGLERSRPSFVSMKKGAVRSVKSGRSASRERPVRSFATGLAESGALSPWDGIPTGTQSIMCRDE